MEILASDFPDPMEIWEVSTESSGQNFGIRIQGKLPDPDITEISGSGIGNFPVSGPVQKALS